MPHSPLTTIERGQIFAPTCTRCYISTGVDEEDMKLQNHLFIFLFVIFIMLPGVSIGKSAEDYLRQGDENYDAGRFDEAIAAYKKAIKLQPDNVLAYYTLGLAYQSKNMLDKATELYQKASQLDPNFAYPYFGLGTTYHSKLIFDKAQEFYKKTAQLEPDFAEAYLQLGNIYFKLGRYREAVLKYQKSLQIIDKDRAAEVSKHLKEAKKKASVQLPLPPKSRKRNIIRKPKSDSNILEDFRVTESQNLRQTDCVPFSPDIYGRYLPRTRYITNFQPFELKNPFLIWQTVVEHISYKTDRLLGGMQEAWQFGEGTYTIRNGDCEDTSILLCDWLRAMGYDAKIAIGSSKNAGHAWVVVFADGKEYFFETAIDSKSISRRHIPYLKSSLKKYAVECMFDDQNYWERASDGKK